jgi:hypothetical protein
MGLMLSSQSTKDANFTQKGNHLEMPSGKSFATAQISQISEGPKA